DPILSWCPRRCLPGLAPRADRVRYLRLMPEAWRPCHRPAPTSPDRCAATSCPRPPEWRSRRSSNDHRVLSSESEGPCPLLPSGRRSRATPGARPPHPRSATVPPPRQEYVLLPRRLPDVAHRAWHYPRLARHSRCLARPERVS